MKKMSKLLSAGMLSVALIFSFVMPVSAEENLDITAKISGPTTNSGSVLLDPQCLLYGYASCESGSALLGNVCVWTARQTGELALAGTRSAASFGEGDSFTNIMAKSYMVTTYPTLLHEYNETANVFTYYEQANTRLYY